SCFVNNGINPSLYACATSFPFISAIPANLMDLSNCNICLQRSFGFTTDKRIILFCFNVMSEIYVYFNRVDRGPILYNRQSSIYGFEVSRWFGTSLPSGAKVIDLQMNLFVYLGNTITITMNTEVPY